MPPKRGRENDTLPGRTVKQQKVLNIIDQKFMKVKDQTFQKFLINELRSKGQENLAMIYKLMGAPETYKGIQRAKRESGLTVDQIIERQIASMDKHSIKYDKKGRIFELRSGDILDFALMMYLDMYHDETVTTDFLGFLKSGIPTTFLRSKKIPFQETNFIKKMKDNGIIGDNLIPIKGFETKFKNNLSGIFDLTDIKYLPARKTGFMKRRIYVCIDQEGKQQHLSTLVDRGKIPRSNPPRYLILPLLTPANFIDAGGGMVGAGVRAEASRMFDHTRDFRLRGKFVPNVDTFIFGRSIIKIIPGDKYKIKLNKQEITAGVTKEVAKKPGATIDDKISKFLGDFLQILSVELMKESKIPVVTASGDGMMSAMSIFIQQRVLNKGKKTKFILDKSLMGSADIIEFYGLSGYLKSGEGDIIKFKNGQNTNNNFSPGSGSVRSYSATPDPKPEGKKRKRIPTPLGATSGARNLLRSRMASAAVRLELNKKNKEIKEKNNKIKEKNNKLARQVLEKRLKNFRIAKRDKEIEEKKKQLTQKNKEIEDRKKRMAKLAEQKLRNEKQKRVTPKTSKKIIRTVPQLVRRSASSGSSAPRKKKSPNSVTQRRSGNGKVESIIRTKSPENVARTKSARPTTSNSTRSNQTRG